QPRVAVERNLRSPRGSGAEPEGAGQPLRVAVEPVDPSGQEVEHGVRGEPGGDERLVHTVARERVDEAGGVADKERASSSGHRAGPAQGKPVSAQIGDGALWDPVCAAEDAQMPAQRRPLALPAADPDVDVVALGEDPAVAAGDRAELELGQPVVAVTDDASGGVALERHA